MVGVVAVSFLALPGLCGAEDGVSEDKIVIGQSAPLTGPAATIGKAAREGALGYFEDVNRRGGVHGRQVVLESVDDNFQAERAAENTRTLIARTKVFALFGYVGGPASVAALPIITAAKVPFVNIRASFADEMGHVIDYLTTSGVRRMAVFYPDDPAGKNALATAEQALKKNELQPAPALGYARNSTDFRQPLAMLAKHESQAVVIFAPPKVAAAFIRDTRKAKLSPQFVGLSVVGASDLVQELRGDAQGVGVSQVVPLPTSATMRIVSEYQKAMSQGGKKDLSHASLEGFVAAKVLVEGLRRAGPALTRERFIGAMEALASYDIGGMVVDFSPTNHNGSTFVELTVVGKGGKILR